MIWSVSTLTRSSGATRPRCTVNGFIVWSLALKHPVANVGKVTSDGRCRRHHRADQMSSPTASLPTFKISIAGGGAALSRLQNVRIHAQAHRASRLPPFEPGILKNAMQPFPLGHALHRLRTRNHHCPNFRTHVMSLSHARRGSQIFNPRIRARSNEHAVDPDVLNPSPRFQAHILQCQFGSAPV